MATFNYKVDEPWEFPEDTVLVGIINIQHLSGLVYKLVSTGHIFVVHPRKNMVAMSKQAAIEIGVWV